MKSLLLALILLVAGSGAAQMAPPLPPVATNAVRKLPPPKAVPPVTNIVLEWKPYTNAYFEVLGKTNMTSTNWYHVTNVWIGATNVVLPVRQPAEFFTIQTIYQ